MAHVNLPFFLARRIYHADNGLRGVSRPAVRIATIGVAVGLAVMIVTVAVVMGFKHTIRDKVVGFGSHIHLENFVAQQTAQPLPVVVSDSLRSAIEHTDGISHLQQYTMTQGILKTDSDFLGLVFKGIGKDYDTAFLRQHLVDGTMPKFGSTNDYPLLVSRHTADQLGLKTGERVTAYFLGNDDIRVRRFTVSGIYQTDMAQFDHLLCFTHYRVPQKLNGWFENQSSGMEITVADFERTAETADKVSDIVNGYTDPYGQTITAQTIQERYPQIFSWLSLLDINVWIILALMVCVAGFTMISGLLIIMLERTQMIGTLKALGIRNGFLSRTFLWLAVFIIGRGMVAGNIVGIAIILLQQSTGFIHLDPANYYVDRAPMEFSLPIIVLLNVATLVVTVMVLIIPSLFVSRINPARTIHFE